MEEVYKEALRAYKMQIDEISSQQAELKSEFEDYVERMQMIKEEERQAFDAFLDREKEVAIDLVFEKTGKKITEKMMNGLARRQVFVASIIGIFEKFRFESINFTANFPTFVPDSASRGVGAGSREVRVSSASSGRS